VQLVTTAIAAFLFSARVAVITHAIILNSQQLLGHKKIIAFF